MKEKLKDAFIAHKGNEYKPSFFRRHIISYLSLFVVIVFLTGSLQSLVLRGSDFLAAVLPNVLVDLTNDNRSVYSLQELSINPLLVQAAQEKANDMAARSYFSHNTPDGELPWVFLDRVGYSFIHAGENLAINFDDSGAVSQAWMNSSGHRANILNGNFSEIGIATAKGTYQGHPTTFVVQFFGRPLVASVSVPEPALANTPPAPVPTPASVVTPTPVEVVAEDDTTIVVRNTNVTEPAPEPTLEATLGTSGASPEFAEEYSSFFDRLLTSPSAVLGGTYSLLIFLLIAIVLVSLIIEFREHRGRHLYGAIFLIVLITLLAILYRYLVASPVFIA